MSVIGGLLWEFISLVICVHRVFDKLLGVLLTPRKDDRPQWSPIVQTKNTHISISSFLFTVYSGYCLLGISCISKFNTKSLHQKRDCSSLQTQGKTRARILGLLPCQYRVQSQYSSLFGDVNDSSNSGISGLFWELLFPATTILIMSQQYWTVTNHKRHRTRALLMFLKPLKQQSWRWGDRFIIHCWRRNRMFALFHGDNGCVNFGAGNCISICADYIVASLINWLE